MKQVTRRSPTELEALHGSCWVPRRERGEEKTERRGGGTRKYKQAVKEKKEAKKQWDGARDDESKERYKKAKKKAKRTVAKVKNKAFQDCTSV